MPGTFLGAGHPAVKQPLPCRASQGGQVVEERMVSKPSPRSPSQMGSQ